MCGIAGAIGDTRENVIKGMLTRIRHRGPDDWGYEIKESSAVGNVRLSIIDPANGHQPMHDLSGDKTVVYNGEIYRYRETREKYERTKQQPIIE